MFGSCIEQLEISIFIGASHVHQGAVIQLFDVARVGRWRALGVGNVSEGLWVRRRRGDLVRRHSNYTSLLKGIHIKWRTKWNHRIDLLGGWEQNISATNVTLWISAGQKT